MNEIRPILKGDLIALKEVLDSIELFPSEMLEDMTSDYFSNPETAEVWFTYLENEIPVSLGFCAPEKLTEGTFNLYAIGVRKDLQGKGVGSSMMNYIENFLQGKNQRLLIVDTSGTDDFKLTRKFYLNLNYTQEAVIRDFWSEGDDKVTFWKKL